jgi:cellulose synthase/poly-beta-1,6-N-acetylglucosamine synthase-like glycosyltransferase
MMDWQREHSPHSTRPAMPPHGSVRPARADLPDAAQARRWLDYAVNHLRRTEPDFSSAYLFVSWQLVFLAIVTAGLLIGLITAPQATLSFVFAAMAAPFLCIVAIRTLAFAHLFARSPTEEHAPSQTRDDQLPYYSVLVPLYQEAEVVPGLLEALAAIDYPKDRLEISLIIESADRATRAALAREHLPDYMRVVSVPDGEPRTKPRALNYALASARGDYVVVYDAEDIPEPDQLRRALSAFRSAGPDLGCVQARLNTYNPNDTFFTRQFTIEYTALFDAILPALARLDLPVPLGGTSNHFPRHILEASGGWDPFNVTEDADLGIRLARRGFRVGVLHSTTWEEAPETFRIWRGQRTRWLKGWMQTYIVHMREPFRLLRELGGARFIALQVLMGGMILSCLVHPWFYAALAISLASGNFEILTGASQSQVLYWIGLFNLLAGYVSAMALGLAAVARRSRLSLALSGLAMPAYWLLISYAAYRALWQLLTVPHLWEKTRHRARHSASGVK